MDADTARFLQLRRINRYYGTGYTLEQLDALEDATIEQMVTLAEKMNG